MNRYIQAGMAWMIFIVAGCSTGKQSLVTTGLPARLNEWEKPVKTVSDAGQKISTPQGTKNDDRRTSAFSGVKIAEVALQLTPLDLSRPPTTEEIMAAGQLGGQLYPTHTLSDPEREKEVNLSFGIAIQEWNKHEYKKAVALFKEHISQYPDSPWKAEAVLHIGCDCQYTGRYTEADQNFNEILSTYGSNQSDGATKMVNKAQLRLGVLKISQNNFDEAVKNFTKLVERSDSWRDKTYASYWLQTLSVMSSDKLALLNCGSMALASILEKKGKIIEAREVRSIIPESMYGQSLSDLQSIAKRYNYDFVGVKLVVSQLPALQLPVIVQLPAKNGGDSGHYWVLQAVTEKTLTLFDAQTNNTFTQNMDEFEREWDGTALVLRTTADDNSTFPFNLLAKGEMEKTWGGCCGVPQPPQCTGDPCACESNSAGGGGVGLSAVNLGPTEISKESTNLAGISIDSLFPKKINSCSSKPSYGEPSWSVNRVNMNLFLTDTPLWYTPPIGPPVDLTLNYNSQSSITYNQPFGNKWQFNYASYLVVDTGGNVTVFMPDGRYDTFYFDGTSNYTNYRFTANELIKVGDNHFYLKFADGSSYEYNIPANTSSMQPYLVTITDRYGKRLSFGYDQNIRLTTITDAVGQVTTLSYNASGLVTLVSDPFGRSASFGYDELKNLIQITDMGGYRFNLSYDANVYLSSISNSTGTTKFRIEPSGTGSCELPSTAMYPPPGCPMWNSYRITITNPLGESEEYYYDAYYMKGSYSSPRYYVPYSNDYDNNYVSNLNKSKFSYGIISGLTWRINEIEKPDGGRTSYTFDMYGNTTSVKDAHGHITSYIYNSKGMVTKVTDPKGNETTYSYADNGTDLVGVTTGLGTISMTYDEKHNPLTVTGLLGNITSSTYTAEGKPATVSDVLGNVTTYTYFDPSSVGRYRLKEVVKGGKVLASYIYDSVGRILTTTSADGITMTYSYDNLNQVTKITYSDGNSVDTVYSTDFPGLKAAITDRSGATTAYSYDQAKRLTKIRNPDKSLTLYDYDADGNMTNLIDANGNVTKFEYDPMGRLIKKYYADNSFLAYTYDLEGLLTSKTNARGIRTNFLYDANHNLTGTTYSDSTPPVTSSYDNYNRITSRTDGIGSTIYSYDAAGRVTSIDGPWDNDTLTLGYDAASRVTSIQPQGGENQAFSYDLFGRMTGAVSGSRQFSYAYSTASIASLPLSLTRPNGSVTSYTYDLLNRLTETTDKTSTGQVIFGNAYTYSTRGMKVSETITNGSAAPPAVDGLVTYNYNNLNQLLSSTPPNQLFTYDADGNMITGVTPEGFQFTASYDAENRLNTIRYTDSSAIQHQTNYHYTSDSFLARQVIDGTETRFVRYGYLPLQERTGANTVARSYLWNLLAPGGIGGLLELSQGGQQYSYTFDGKGNVRGLLGSDQSLVVSYEYSPFGALVSKSGSVDQPFLFSTKSYDGGSGLAYYGYRYYSPLLERWMNRDPLGETGGINLYAFTENNPLNYVDSLGLIGGSVQGGGQGSVHWLIGGLSFSCGGVAGASTSNGAEVCAYCQVCLRLGPGIYAGVGGAFSGSIYSGALSSGGFSVGIGGDIGSGPSIGGQVSVGVDQEGINSGSVGTGKGGVGYGISLGMDFCWTELVCKEPKCTKKPTLRPLTANQWARY